MTIRPRRSVLYMPGSNARALEKAKTLAADGVILDLEDSVAPDAKEAARAQVAAAVKAGGFGRREVFIRVNGVDTPWHADDLAAAAQAAPDAILVPKVSTPDTLELIGRRLLDMGTEHKTRVWAMIETPLAHLQHPVASRPRRAIPKSRLVRLRHGHQRSRQGDPRAPGAGAGADAVVAVDLRAAARIHGIDILDGVYNDIGNAEGFAAECRQGAELGFDGKTLIHPEPDRAVQRGLLALGRGGGMGAQDDRRVRSAGEQGQGRGLDRRPHGRAAACRHGAAHGGDRRGDRGESLIRAE